MQYYAKSDGHTTVKKHSAPVANLAGQYGHEIGIEKTAYHTGLLHDICKYSDPFQDVLQQIRKCIDHAFPGAAMSTVMFQFKANQIAETIAAHHSYLRSYDEIWPDIKSLLKGEIDRCPSGKQSAVTGQKEFREILARFYQDWPGIQFPQLEKLHTDTLRWKNNLLYMMQLRFLLSCLVDADYTISGYEATQNAGLLSEGPELNPETCLKKLKNYRRRIIRKNRAEKNIQSLRAQVYRDAGIAAKNPSHALYTMTAPTGSGKTFAMLRFALERCALNTSKKRIIIVLPFLSISDQIADIVTQIIPDAIIDNSQVDVDESQREITSKWSAPCIITTTVQFFGSLFSAQAGDCRKLHRIANSVILFDEIQALPEPVSRIVVQSLYYLTEHYNSCICLSTATQPAYQKIQDLDFPVKEILRNRTSAFAKCIRTKFDFMTGKYTLEEIGNMAASHDNICIIVNMRKHARALYHYLESKQLKNCFIISTDLCPEHRRNIIAKIKRLQDLNEPVHVISTQCIEAGVDMDFQHMFRALAPLPSLIQSAGRLNRNGLFGLSNMHIFELNEPGKLYPDGNYERQSILVKNLHIDGIELESLSGIETYYARTFENFDEPKKLKDSILKKNFKAYADESRLIKHNGYQVITPYDTEAYQEILQAVLTNCTRKYHIRKSYKISVSSYDMQSIQQHCQELVIYRRQTGAETHTGIYILLPGHEDCYNNKTGLEFRNQVMII